MCTFRSVHAGETDELEANWSAWLRIGRPQTRDDGSLAQAVYGREDGEGLEADGEHDPHLLQSVVSCSDQRTPQAP